LASSEVRDFEKGCIINLNKTPIPFEFLDRYTYNFEGVITVRGKSARSGWGERQATLILYTFTDGSKPITLKLLFYRSGLETAEERRNRITERKKCPGSSFVTIQFNLKAYNNESYLLSLLKHEFVPYRESVGKDFLFMLD
ncbi:hypothetical protein K469DRAFT_598068, partial [Zopfia rhizophila CBS 207.26]